MPDNGGKRLKEEYETIDLLEILRLLKKNLLVILAVTILLAVAGYLISTFAMTPQYEASATLIVNSREDQAAAQAPITNDQLTSATKLVDTYAVILTSDTVLDKTISNLNLNMSYNDLVERVRIESVNSTQVMKITVKDTDSERARAIAADIVEQAPEIIIQTVKAGSVEIISQAKAEPEPVSPSKAKNTVLAGMLGLVISVGIVILRYLLNNKFMTDDDITNKLGLTVLGVIPQIDMKGER
jgi:capsular polysaccharide biosynthesis protein